MKDVLAIHTDNSITRDVKEDLSKLTHYFCGLENSVS